MARKALLALAGVVVAGSAGAVAATTAPLPEAAYAAEYVVRDVARTKTRAARACPGCTAGGVEVIIGLLGAGGPATTHSLLNLLAVQLEPGAAQARSCQIARRGKELASDLKRFDPRQAARWCEATYDGLQRRGLVAGSDGAAGQVCRSEAAIEADRSAWIAAMRSDEDLFANSGAC